ncbi:MAG TPA: helix-turn-helix domain-containing protein [Lacisediminihabitans sp.]|uniref:TetR/AcrR family transcriptional regulator n=1 Tax=Lacisediminihabitans sp. TaxID=2787631 RepID=UPI002ED9F27F
MAGSRKDVRDRLLRAALDLFSERGYDRTTAADIADRADVTERTYFRHFSDKREALFDGEGALQHALAGAVAEVPAGLSPSETLLRAFLAMIPALEHEGDLKKRRQAVIAAAPELRERELSKEAHLISGVAEALETRGVRAPVAVLAAVSGIAVLSRARLEWLAGASDDYATLLRTGFADLRAALASEPASPGR